MCIGIGKVEIAVKRSRFKELRITSRHESCKLRTFPVKDKRI